MTHSAARVENKYRASTEYIMLPTAVHCWHQNVTAYQHEMG